MSGRSLYSSYPVGVCGQDPTGVVGVHPYTQYLQTQEDEMSDLTGLGDPRNPPRPRGTPR